MYAHFSAPPAMPTTFFAPLILAIWPAAEPVAPAAPEMTTTSPSVTCPTSITPK